MPGDGAAVGDSPRLREPDDESRLLPRPKQPCLRPAEREIVSGGTAVDDEEPNASDRDAALREDKAVVAHRHVHGRRAGSRPAGEGEGASDTGQEEDTGGGGSEPKG